jgi:hypothetical protein
MRTSFHHQPEAQHPKSPAIETPPGRLPHLSGKRRFAADAAHPLIAPNDMTLRPDDVCC